MSEYTSLVQSEVSVTTLSERIRPNSEAAPWVVQEVINIEKELALSESLHRLALKERDHEREINRQLLNALHQISLAIVRAAANMVGQDDSAPLKINLPPNSFEDDWNASGMDAYDDL